MYIDIYELFRSQMFFPFMIFFLSFIYYKTWCSRYWKRRNANYLQARFPVGNMSLRYSLSENLRYVYRQMKRRNWKHGGAFVGWIPTYVVVDLEYVKKVMVTDFEIFRSRGIYVNEEAEPHCSNIVTLDGDEKWKKMRSIFVSTLSTGKLKIIVNFFLQHLQDFEKVFENRIRERTTVLRFDELIDCFFVDFLCDYVFGINARSVEMPDDNIFKRYTDELFEHNGFRLLKTYLTLALPHDLLKRVGVKMFPSHVTDYFMDIIEKSMTMRNKGEVIRQDLIQVVLEIKKSTELSFDEIIMQIITFYVASLETTSSTTVAAFYELAQHPEIQDKVRAEIKTVLKKRGEKLNYEALSDFIYLGQVICETVRKYPAIPEFLRKLNRNFKIDDNVELEKDTYIFIPTLGLHYDEEYFPCPDEFDPDRFSNENIEKIPKFAYIPFGAGPRKCPGKFFAEIQLKFILATFIIKYKFTLNGKSKNVRIDRFASTLKFNKGIWLNIEKI